MILHSSLILNGRLQRQIFEGANQSGDDPDFDPIKASILAEFPGETFDGIVSWGIPTGQANHKGGVYVGIGCDAKPAWMIGSPLESHIQYCKKYFDLQTKKVEWEVLFRNTVDPLISVPSPENVKWVGQKYDDDGTEQNEWNVYLQRLTPSDAQTIIEDHRGKSDRTVDWAISRMNLDIYSGDCWGLQFKKSDLKLRALKLFIFARKVILYEDNARTKLKEYFENPAIDFVDNDDEIEFTKFTRDKRGFILSGADTLPPPSEYTLVDRPDGKPGKLRKLINEVL